MLREEPLCLGAEGSLRSPLESELEKERALIRLLFRGTCDRDSRGLLGFHYPTFAR